MLWAQSIGRGQRQGYRRFSLFPQDPKAVCLFEVPGKDAMGQHDRAVEDSSTIRSPRLWSVSTNILQKLYRAKRFPMTSPWLSNQYLGLKPIPAPASFLLWR